MLGFMPLSFLLEYMCCPYFLTENKNLSIMSLFFTESIEIIIIRSIWRVDFYV